MRHERKQISVVRLTDHVPDGLTLDEWLVQLEEAKEDVFVCRAVEIKGNPLVAMQGEKVIGVVNTNCLRFINQLLVDDPEGFFARFKRVSRSENHHPALRYNVVIDAERIEPIVPDEKWKEWVYTGPRLRRFISSVSPSALLKQLTKKVMDDDECEYGDVKHLISALQESMLYDMSVDTTDAIDDVMFWLECRRSPEADKILEELEGATTKRRTQSCRQLFASKVWPEFLCSNVCKEMWEYFCRKHMKDGKIDDDSLTAAYEKYLGELRDLPYELYMHADDVCKLSSMIFYKHITYDKQIDLFSCLALGFWVKKWQKGEVRFEKGADGKVEMYFNMQGCNYIENQIIKHEK